MARRRGRPNDYPERTNLRLGQGTLERVRRVVGDRSGAQAELLRLGIEELLDRIEGRVSPDPTGFLDPAINGWITHHRRANAEWFQLAEALSRAGQVRAREFSIDADDGRLLLAAALFLRGLQTFEEAIVLAERGATTGARTLLRSCIETVFWLGASKTHPDFVEAVVRHDRAGRGKIARALVEGEQKARKIALDPADADRVTAFLDEISAEPSQELSAFEAARHANMLPFYTLHYRGLSNDAAHPSPVSLDRHMVERHDGRKVLVGGPDAPDVADTIMTACTQALQLLGIASDIFGPTTAQPALDEAFGTYKRLVERSRAEAGL